MIQQPELVSTNPVCLKDPVLAIRITIVLNRRHVIWANAKILVSSAKFVQQMLSVKSKCIGPFVCALKDMKAIQQLTVQHETYYNALSTKIVHSLKLVYKMFVNHLATFAILVQSTLFV